MAGAGGEWRRSWWLLLTLVPMGLLAPFVFAGAGIWARRRDWIGWALVYAFVFWGAVAVASIDELDRLDRAAGGVLVLGTPVPVVHALLIRRAYLAATAEPEDPIAARHRRVGRTALGLRLVGAAFAAMGAAMAAQGDLAGLAPLAMGLAFLTVGFLRQAAPRATPVVGPAEGSPEPGLVFRYSAKSLRRGQAMLALFALGSVAMAVWAPDPFDRAVGGGAAVVLMACAFASARGAARERSLVLTPTGLRDTRGGGTFVPWDVVESVYGVEMSGGHVMVALTVTDRSAIEVSTLERLLMRLSPGSLGHVSYAPAALGVEPEWLVDAIAHYVLHPQDRRELGTHRAVERFQEIARATASAPA